MEFNWDKFKNERVAVHCDTEEKAEEFIKECHSHNICWDDGSLDTCWSVEGKFTCYSCGYRSKNKMIHDTENELGYENVRFYSTQDYKIIKWESEKMKFKAGDKVKSINGQYGEIVAFNILTEHPYKVKFQSGCHAYCRENELELISQEFTFQEVIARIKSKESYVCTWDISNVQEIRKEKSGKIILKLSQNMHTKDEIHIPLELKFKLQEPKKRVRIYKIEHQKNGKQYDFISSQLLDCDEFVICDTKCGKSYGRIADVRTIALTESEVKEYKECWRV